MMANPINTIFQIAIRYGFPTTGGLFNCSTFFRFFLRKKYKIKITNPPLKAQYIPNPKYIKNTINIVNKDTSINSNILSNLEKSSDNRIKISKIIKVKNPEITVKINNIARLKPSNPKLPEDVPKLTIYRKRKKIKNKKEITNKTFINRIFQLLILLLADST